MVVIAGTVGWSIGIMSRYYDDDEVSWAHSIWLTSLGLRPYHDFFEVHPPFFWFLLAPISKLFGPQPHILTFYRFLSAVGLLFFVSGIVANVRLALPSYRLWALWGIALVTFYPSIMDFIVESRLDNWAHGLSLWSIWRFRVGRDGDRKYLEFGFLSSIATLTSFKLALLAPIIVFFESLRFCKGPRVLARAWRDYSVGVVLALAVGLLVLAIKEVDVFLALTSVVAYHLYFNYMATLGFGLLKSIVENYPPLIFIGAGILAWLGVHWSRREIPNYFEISLVAFLLLQALLVAPPYKQYYAPWFLLGSYFICYLGFVLYHLRYRCFLLVASCTCLISLYGIGWNIRHWRSSVTAGEQRYLIDVMNQITLPEDRVVAAAPFHPIFRRDVFFGWLATYDPGGFGSEYLAQNLTLLKPYFSEKRYRRELEQHSPALIYLSRDVVLDPGHYYPPIQYKVLLAFLRGRDYRIVFLRQGFFAIRPDRYERFRLLS